MILGIIPRGRHLLLYDVLATCLAVVLSFAIRFEANDILTTMGPYLPTALVPFLIHPPVYVAFGLYRREWRYASVREMFAIAAAVGVAAAISFGVLILLAAIDAPGSHGFPRSVLLIQALLNVALVGGGRFLLRASLERRQSSTGAEGPALMTLVYGAGEAGASVARLTDRDPKAAVTVVGFLDDDLGKRGSRLHGRTVYGGLADLERAVSRTGAEALLIAMPSAEGRAIRRALEAGQELGLEVRTVPPLGELVSGRVPLSRIRHVRVEDLLRRAPVGIDTEAVAAYLNGASVLVTGGGGSIGSELARQIMGLGPRALTVVDHHEWALWAIDRELEESRGQASDVEVRSVLADVRSASTIEALLRQTKPDVVFHAAALKHVPIVERFPSQGVLTNVIGTRNVLRASAGVGVSRFVLISSDKAVEPTSVMGATKLLAEYLTVAANGPRLRTKAVRFGNVLGSSGSVVPIFERQLAEGRPLTITHPEATRYFMTIQEAVGLILEAGSTDESGEIYVLDMGEPIRIVDLAADLIRLTGKDPEAIPMIFTGLRPGERLHESLLQPHESTEATRHPGVLRARTDLEVRVPAAFDDYIDLLDAAARDGDDQAARALLHEAGHLAPGLRTAGAPGSSAPAR